MSLLGALGIYWFAQNYLSTKSAHSLKAFVAERKKVSSCMSSDGVRQFVPEEFVSEFGIIVLRLLFGVLGLFDFGLGTSFWDE